MSSIAKQPKPIRQLAARFEQSRRWHHGERSGVYTSESDLCNELVRLLGPPVAESVTAELFKRSVARRIRQTHPVTADDLAELLRAVEALPIEEFHVVRSVHGVKFLSEENKLGRTIIRTRDALRREMETWPGDKQWLEVALPEGPVAEVKIRARTAEAALILGDRILTEFESIMRLVACGSEGHTDFNVFEARTSAYLAYLVHGPSSTITGSTVVGPAYEMEYSEEELRADKFFVPARALWDIHAREDRTPVERKIMTAAFWLSLARRETDPVKSLPYSWYSIGALLPFSRAESTIGQISRWATHLLDVSAANAELRKRDIEQLYDHRSDIAHGRVSHLPLESRREALDLAGALLNNACDERLRHAGTEKEFGEAILAISMVEQDSRPVRGPGTRGVTRIRRDAPRPGSIRGRNPSDDTE